METSIYLPKTEQELELYFLLHRLHELKKEAQRFVMQCGPNFGPKYDDKAIKRFEDAKKGYLKKVNELK